MPAYLVADIEVIDRDLYDEYRKGVPPTVAAHGGRFLVRGGATQTLEGDWSPKRAVVIEFPDAAALKRWYDSPSTRRCSRCASARRGRPSSPWTASRPDERRQGDAPAASARTTEPTAFAAHVGGPAHRPPARSIDDFDRRPP